MTPSCVPHLQLKIYQTNPEGVVTVKFTTQEAADQCVALMQVRVHLCICVCARVGVHSCKLVPAPAHVGVCAWCEGGQGWSLRPQPQTPGQACLPACRPHTVRPVGDAGALLCGTAAVSRKVGRLHQLFRQGKLLAVGLLLLLWGCCCGAA